MKIDKWLNKYATKKGYRPDYQRWWNGDGVLAAAIEERAELKTLERYMKFYLDKKAPHTTVEQDKWLHAEAMWLFSRWFSRLWD